MEVEVEVVEVVVEAEVAVVVVVVVVEEEAAGALTAGAELRPHRELRRRDLAHRRERLLHQG